MKTILSLLLALNIIQPYTVMNDNLTGNSSFSNFVQVSYEYTTEDPSIAIELGYSTGAVSGNVQNEFPAIYCMNLTFNFKSPIESAEMIVNLYDPGNTAGFPALNVIGENCFITANSRSQMTVKAYNTDVCYIKIIWSYEDVHDCFGYTAYSFDYTELQSNNNDWIKNGKTYVYVYNCRLTSCTLHSDPNYTSQLTSLINNTDGLESLLTAIRTNTSYLPTISTNISSLNTLLNNINDKLDTLNNIKWNDFNSSFIGTTLDFESYDTSSWRALSANTNIVFGRNDVNASNDYGIFRLYIPIGQNNLTENDIHVYQLNDSNVKRDINMSLKFYTINRYSMTLYFYTSQSFNEYLGGNFRWCVTIDKWDYLYDASTIKLSYLLPTDDNFWTLYNTMSQFTQLKSINNNLSQIISILGTTDISFSDEQNKQTVDNKFNELIQNLTLPNIPEKPSKLPFIQHLFQVYGEIINIPGLDIFKWFIGIEAIVLLMGVIVK